VRLGAINLIRSSRESIRIAQAAEAAGFWGLGMGDTVPKLYQDMYVTAAACFAATERLHIGPTVTNTVTRHWSVLGATARTFGELYPGRFFAGVATGDGACHSVGLTPSTWAKLKTDVANIRSWAPADMELHIAASGPRGVEAAGRVATDLILGTGLDVTALRTLSARARAARTAAGITAFRSARPSRTRACPRPGSRSCGSSPPAPGGRGRGPGRLLVHARGDDPRRGRVPAGAHDRRGTAVAGRLRTNPSMSNVRQ